MFGGPIYAFLSEEMYSISYKFRFNQEIEIILCVGKLNILLNFLLFLLKKIRCVLMFDISFKVYSFIQST